MTPLTELRADARWRLTRCRDDAGRVGLVKAVAADTPDRSALARRLSDEFDALRRCDSPHLLRPLAIDRAGGVATFADARGPLAAVGRLPPAQVASVLLQAATALEALHARGFAAGGLGLHSLLVGPAGELLLGDFLPYRLGGAVPAPDPPVSCLAPEHLSTRPGRAGPAADLYVLGWLGLELLAGPRLAAVYDLPAGADRLAWHADLGRPPADWRGLLAEVPTGLLDLLAGLVAKPPAARRWTTAAAFRAAVAASGQACAARLDFPCPTARVGR